MYKFGKKFRIIKAIEKEDIRLLNHLMQTQNHNAQDPVDKLGGNILHMACFLGKATVLQWIIQNFNLDLEQYNNDGSAPVHCAISGGNLNIVQFLYDQGADIHALTVFYKESPVSICQRKMEKAKSANERNKYHEIKDFIMEKYFTDFRGYEVRKFFWVYLSSSSPLADIPYNLAREIAEFI